MTINVTAAMLLNKTVTEGGFTFSFSSQSAAVGVPPVQIPALAASVSEAAVYVTATNCMSVVEHAPAAAMSMDNVCAPVGMLAPRK